MTRSKINRLIYFSFSMIVISIFLIACGPKPPAEIVVDPLRFAKVVDDYKAADKVRKPLPNSLLFVGSSTIHGWKTLAEDFPEVNAVNRGMGGSHMSDLIYYLEDIVYPYHPNAIVVYEGDNDISAGKTPGRVFEDYLTFVSRVYTKWPNLPIFFVSIKPSLARVQHLEKMAEANALIKTHTEQHKSLFYIDIFTPMLGADGLPRPEIFGDDGLHMNETGYTLWTQEIRRELGLE